MKLKTLLLSAVLLSALGEVRAYTSVAPQVGRSYYLYNIGTGQYWHRASSTYETVADIANATPITIESGNKLAYVYEGTTYRIHHDNGTQKPNSTEGVNFTFDGSATSVYGYQLKSKHSDYDRWMCPDGTFQQKDKWYNRDWYFISVYEVNSGTADECASTAEASYLSSANEWERVTDIATLEASLSDYFFAIVCANYPGLMVNMADGNSGQQASGYAGSKSMWYSNSANPETNNSFLWRIEKCNESGYEGYTFRNASYPTWTIQAESSASQFAHTHDQANPCRWSSYALAPTNGVFTIKTLANGGDNYLGLWTPSNDYISGQELAGNKGTAEQGKFLIYRKLVKNVDLTSYIKNPSFDSDAGNWDLTSSGEEGYYVFAWVGTGGIEEYNRKTVKCEQTINNLPNGIYKLSVQGYYRGGGGGYTGNARNAKLYADDEEVEIKSINDYTGITSQPATGNWKQINSSFYVPDNTDAANYVINTLHQYNNEVTVAVSDGTLKIGVKKDAEVGSDWTYFDNFSLTYIEGLHDLTALSGKMKASVKTAQTIAVSTYNGSKTAANYFAAKEAIADAEASIAAYANAATYLSRVEAVLATTNFYTSDAYDDVYGDYKTTYDDGTMADATADGLNYKVASYTPESQRYTDNTANDLLIPGWKIGETVASTTDSKFYINSWSTESDGSGDAADFANPFYEYWTGNASLDAKVISGTITGLIPNAPYSISANVRVQGSSKVAGSITMKVGSGSTVDVTAGNQIGTTTRYIKNYTAVGTADADGKLTLTFTVDGSSNISWLAFRDVNYTRLADASDYSALNAAISTAEAKTLGFETGEYAPYNNIAALTALAAAKAINQEADNTQEAIQTATSNLTGATWTANVGDVDAIYNGDFAIANGNNPEGWTRSNGAWGQQITGLSTAANDVASGTTTAWYYNTNGSWQYGNDDLYTMPLAGNQLYKLTFRYRKNGNDWQNWMKASVLKGAKGLEAVEFPAADDGTHFKTVVAYFETAEAGEYILSIEQNGNAHLTDVSLVKATESEITLSESNDFTPASNTYYQTLKLGRTFPTDKISTMVLPFAMDSEATEAAFEEVYKLSGVEGTSIKFEAATEIIKAKPYLVKAKSATVSTSNIMSSDLAAAASNDSETDDGTTVTFQGTFSRIDDVDAIDNSYIVSGNNLYEVNSAVALKPFRAYFTIVTSALVKNFVLDFGDETAIRSIDNGQLIMDNSEIYNLAGQRLSKAQKGINIINGKKVLVK